jgi:hypothetical protein
MNEAPDWLKEPHKKILVAFKRLGGRGHIADVRLAAKVKTGDRYVRRLIEHNLMRQLGYDDYGLTPEGFTMANRFITEGM